MIRRVFTGHEIAQGQIIPPWYGIAWREPWRDVAVCYPIPLNFVIAVALRARWALKRGLPATWRERCLAAEKQLAALRERIEVANDDRRDATSWRALKAALDSRRPE